MRSVGFVARFRGFDTPSRMLLINQFGINVGFYMLMPYLAGYLAGPLARAGGVGCRAGPGYQGFL